MQTVRVATFDGPGAAPEIQTVPRPNVPDKAALIEDRCLWCVRDRFAYPQGALAQATALALYAGS